MACTPITPCAPFLHCLGTGEHLKHHDSPHKRRYHTPGNNINILFLVCTRPPCPMTPPVHRSTSCAFFDKISRISDQQCSPSLAGGRIALPMYAGLTQTYSCTPPPLPCYRTVAPTTLSSPSPMHQSKLQGVFLTRIGYMLFCGTTNPIFLDRLMVVLYKKWRPVVPALLFSFSCGCGFYIWKGMTMGLFTASRQHLPTSSSFSSQFFLFSRGH